MHPTGQKNASFSPYHDEDRLFDFLDDDAQRHASTAVIVFLVHVGLALSLSGSFIVPDLKPPPEPEAVTVEIITFDPEPELEEAPEPIVIEPQFAPTPPAAVPEPQPPKQQPPEPEPRPDPTPPPPPPEPEPQPEPIPEPIFTPPPPPPEIIAQPAPIAPEALPERLPEPEPLPEPLPEPIIEIFEPVPQPIPEPIPEPLPVPELEPILEIFDPLPFPEPVLEPLPEPTLDPAPLIEVYEPEPLPEPEPEPDFEPVILDLELPPTPGIIRAEPLPEIVEPEPLPSEIIVEPDPNPEPEPEPLREPELEPLPELDLIITAPTVLASPDAPETQAEERRAVPQEQSDPFLDLLKKDRDSRLDEPIASRPPARGGGNDRAISLGGSTAAPPGGGTQIGRSNPGAGSWSLGPQPTTPGNGYENLNLDIRCREEGRTHEDCPEYINRNRGRDHTGWESFDGHAGTGTDRGDRISASRRMPTRGELAPALGIGDPSVNSGGPSTSAMDFQDTNFDREFLGTPLNNGPQPPGLIDRLTPSDPTIPEKDWTLTPPPDTPRDDDAIDWVLDPDSKE